MKFGVVKFPGSNCDDDIIYILKDILGHQVVQLWHKDTDLQNVDGLFLPGGLSYGADKQTTANKSPIMQTVKEFANKGGFVFGISNGFQILCEANLLPGKLLLNNSQKYICKNVYIKADNNKTMITADLDGDTALKVPIAHSDGRYFAEGKTISDMRKNGQILFRYCDEYSQLSEEFNPNGSVENIAGVCNKKKNVYGMMPHPERAADDELGNTDGLLIFQTMMKSILSKR